MLMHEKPCLIPILIVRSRKIYVVGTHSKGLIQRNISNRVCKHLPFCQYSVQSTLVISNSHISNNRLSRSENLVPGLTQRSTNRQQNIVEILLFSTIFSVISNLGVKLKIHSVKGGCSIFFLSSANLICRSTDISKCFIESLGFQDNKSRLYF